MSNCATGSRERRGDVVIAHAQRHEAFCAAEGWQPVRNAQGKTGTHHVTYELHLYDGRILRTRISHPVNRNSYGQEIWSHILRDQLDVDQAAFRALRQDGIKPDRGAAEPPRSEE